MRAEEGIRLKTTIPSKETKPLSPIDICPVPAGVQSSEMLSSKGSEQSYPCGLGHCSPHGLSLVLARFTAYDFSQEMFCVPVISTFLGSSLKL